MKSMLVRKGFQLCDTHHDYYWFWVNGRKTNIHTFFSDGQKKYDKQLLVFVKRQIRLQDWEQFDRFMDCDMEGGEYLQRMIAENHVLPPKSPEVKEEKPKKKK